VPVGLLAATVAASVRPGGDRRIAATFLLRRVAADLRPPLSALGSSPEPRASGRSSRSLPRGRPGRRGGGVLRTM
jgi:hypothetical protein